MAYIGNIPAEKYSAFQKQDFTTSATTSYTLDNPVANANELALFINFVRQERTTAYSASGTSLTLTSATSSSDDMYCVYLGKAVQTVNPPNGSVGTAQLADDAVTKAKTSNLMYPAFEALGNGEQSLSNATQTLVEFPNERFDTDSCYDNTSGNFKFTPNVAGKYFIYTTVRGFSTTDDKLDFMTVRLFKNGTRVNSNSINTDQGGGSGDTLHGFSMTLNFIQEANGSSDYFQIKAQLNCNSGTPSLYGTGTDTTAQDLLFGAYRIGD